MDRVMVAEFYCPDYAGRRCRGTVCRNPNVATGADGRTTVTICDTGFSRSLAVNDIVIASATPLKCV